MKPQPTETTTNLSNIVGTVLNTLRYAFLAGIIFVVSSQILLNLIPYNSIVSQVSQLGNRLSEQIVTSLAAGVTRVEDTNGNITNLTSTSEGELAASAIGAIINIIFVSLMFLVGILFIVSIALTIIGMLLLSQSRNVFESILLVTSFAIPRQRKHWGVIFDQTSNAPVPFASVRVLAKLKDNQLTQVTQTIADLDGRYRVYIADKTKTYSLLINAPGYKDSGRLLENLQTNEIIEDMALNPVGKQERNFSSWLANLRPQISNRVINYLFLLSILAAFFALYNLVQYRRPVDYIAAVIYGFGVIWNTLFFRDRRIRTAGRILDQEQDKPIESAFVRILRGGKTLVSAVTDKNGIVKFDLEPGTYLLEVNKPNYEIISDSLSQSNIDMVKITAQGYLSKNVLMRRMATGTGKDNDLMNPFA